MIYRFRIILDNDTEDDVFRDLEIRENNTLEDLHNTIVQAFGFDGLEMASFYISDEQWNQGDEIAMFAMEDQAPSMATTAINDVVHEASPKLIYVYDFLNMWTFYVELAEIVEEAQGTDYPNLMFAHGQLPEQAPQKNFEAEAEEDPFNDFDDDLDIDDYDNLNFDENWN